MISLPEVRDLLLPGLWIATGKYGSDYEADISVDFEEDKLIVKAYRFSTKKLVKFDITRNDISQMLYKAEFKPFVEKLFQELQ